MFDLPLPGEATRPSSLTPEAAARFLLFLAAVWAFAELAHQDRRGRTCTQRRGLGKDLDYKEYYGALRRLIKYVHESGLPIGITEEEAEIFAEVVEKQLP